MTLWALGTAVTVGRLLVGAALVWRLRRSSRPVAAPVLHAAAERARQVLGLRVAPRLLESELAPTPMVVGLTRPVIVLPAGLEQTLATDQLDAVLLHEAAHIAHRDPLIGVGQRLAAALFWWCPLLHAVNRRLNELREDICDNYVIQTQGDGYRLARVLVAPAPRWVAR